MFTFQYDKNGIEFKCLIVDSEGNGYSRCTTKQIAQHVCDVLNKRLAQGLSV